MRTQLEPRESERERERERKREREVEREGEKERAHGAQSRRRLESEEDARISLAASLLLTSDARSVSAEEGERDRNTFG